MPCPTVHHDPGGSAGMRHCLSAFVSYGKQGRDPYELIDQPLPFIARQTAGVGTQWRATFNRSSASTVVNDEYTSNTFTFGSAEWLVPPNYEPRVLETRVVFVHGGSADTPAVEPVHCSEGGANCSYYTYTGFTSRLSNWTQLPVLAFDFPTEPVAPWPSNIRHVLEYLHHALLHGPRGGGRAGGLILVADSEGSLVAMQAVTAVLDASLRTLMGYGATLANPSRWLRRIVLSSPVVDVECTTASFAWNCCVRHGLDPSRTRTFCARALCRLACPLFIWSSYGCMADPFALGSVPSSLQAGTRQAAAEIPTLGCARTWQPQARSSRRA